MSIADGKDNLMGGSLREVLLNNIDEMIKKHKEMKKKSPFTANQVESLNKFKVNLDQFSYDMYQTRLLDLEKTVQEEDERQNNVFNFEA
jgi:hypothetical protein